MNQGKHKRVKNLKLTIRLSNFKLIFLPVIFMAIIYLLFTKIPFTDILIPQKIDHLSSLQTNNMEENGYCSISTQNWLYSGYNHYKDKSITEYIFYNISDDICYFLLASPEYVNKDDMTLKYDSINVAVQNRTNSFNSFLSQFASDINWNYESLSDASATIVLNTTSYNVLFYKILFVVLLIVSIYLLILIVYFGTQILLPILSPEFGIKHRHSYNRIKSRSEFAMLLQAELDNYLYRANNLYITKNYIINLQPGDIHIIPLNKLCFIFEHGNLHKLLWFYMKVTHTIYFLCSNSLKCHFTHNNSNDIDQLMNILKELIPNLMIGYSTEHQLKYMEIIKEKRH